MRGHDRINRCLPDELLIEIFRRLHDSKPSRDACSLVCKRWLNLECLSRSTLHIGASGCPDHFLGRITRRFVNVKTVHIDERLSLPIQFKRRCGSESTSSYTKKRRYVKEKSGSEDSDFETSCISDAMLSVLGEGFSKLEKLSLIWCNNVTSTGLASLAQKCSLLKSLDLQGCYVGDPGLAAVGQCCKWLEDLNLRFCEGLTDAGVIELALGCGKSLNTLGVAACAKITDISLEAVGLHCKSLETLSLDSEYVSDKGMLAVAKGCPLLKVLKIQCVNVTDEALAVVGTCCLSLEFLALYSLQKFTDKGLRAIGSGCKKLKNLTLSDCYFLSDKGLEAIATGCKELTHLEVNGCHNIGTLGLESIGKYCQYVSLPA
nr:F-box/LRR-repeat protein 4 isoform X3 [Quercus suber]